MPPTFVGLRKLLVFANGVVKVKFELNYFSCGVCLADKFTFLVNKPAGGGD